MNGYDVKWDGKYNVEITAPNSRGNVQLGGLCGNANGDQGDDLADGNAQTVCIPLFLSPAALVF